MKYNLKIITKEGVPKFGPFHTSEIILANEENRDLLFSSFFNGYHASYESPPITSRSSKRKAQYLQKLIDKLK